MEFLQIAIISSENNSCISEIVGRAMQRSFSSGPLITVNPAEFDLSYFDGIVLCGSEGIEPNFIKALSTTWQKKQKVLILGRLDNDLAGALGLNFRGNIDNLELLAQDVESTGYIFSNLKIKYDSSHFLGKTSIYKERALYRYDFQDEWNNLGFGRVEIGQSIWSLSDVVESTFAQPIAWVTDQNENILTLYSSITDFHNVSFLWFNRSVGPVDSLEWRIVEVFFCDYRPEDLPCFPCLREIPLPYDAAVTMHIDCDEAIYSARDLFELYYKSGFPVTMAVKTGLDIKKQDLELLKDVLASGGAIVSHSKNHLENWGPTFEIALNEAKESRLFLEKTVTSGKPVLYAVSPFYKNPRFAVRALYEAGYRGFVGGIISSDPEYLLGRGGVIPFVDNLIVSHSEQCMLHGDCYHAYGDSLKPYIDAFENSRKAQVIFGYLDHPFSERYWYGWYSEKERLSVHEKLLYHFKKFDNIWLCNLEECLGFIYELSQLVLKVNKSEELVVKRPSGWAENESIGNVGVFWKGRLIAL